MDTLPIKDLMCLFHHLQQAAADILALVDTPTEVKSLLTYRAEQLKQQFDIINSHIESATPKLIEAASYRPSS